MLEEIRIDPTKNNQCWLAYLDLLGAGRLIESEQWEDVFCIYAESLKHFKRDGFDEHLVFKKSFSDSFVLYTADATNLSYRALDSFVRYFIISLINREIPIRGAMSFGQMYSDPEHDLFFGQALLEAYRIGESQDWIGFVLCPSAVSQLTVVGLPANERLNYATWPIPTKPCHSSAEKESHTLPAFIMESGQGLCLGALQRMHAGASIPTIKRKYANTLEFLSKSQRKLVSP
ncbi:MAG: hypothetical protein IPQ13_13830 [Holophagaceae bacterium]|nr:hypothetical protein [Holophagaceae bacterium]